MFSALMRQTFIRDFRKGMRADWSFSARLDELLYFPSWPITFLFSRTGVTPNQIVLVSFLCGVGFVAGLFAGWLNDYPLAMSLLILLRIFLDCVDGQLARYTDRASNLGALYDLAADFVFAILFFIGLAVTLSDSLMDSLLFLPFSLVALAAFLCTTTAFSFLSLQIKCPDESVEILKRRFVLPLPDDRVEDEIYSRKLRLLNGVFALTWRPVSMVVFRLLFRNNHKCLKTGSLSLFSPFEYSVQLLIFPILLNLGISPFRYLILAAAGAGVMAVLLKVYRRTC